MSSYAVRCPLHDAFMFNVLSIGRAPSAIRRTAARTVSTDAGLGQVLFTSFNRFERTLSAVLMCGIHFELSCHVEQNAILRRQIRQKLLLASQSHVIDTRKACETAIHHMKCHLPSHSNSVTFRPAQSLYRETHCNYINIYYYISIMKTSPQEYTANGEKRLNYSGAQRNYIFYTI